MTKDNLVTILMIVFLAAMLIFVTRAMLSNESQKDAQAAPNNHMTNGAPAKSQQPANTPVSSGQLDENESTIWTSEEMQEAQPYPMPMLPGSGPTSVADDKPEDKLDRPSTIVEGGKPSKP